MIRSLIKRLTGNSTQPASKYPDWGEIIQRNASLWEDAKSRANGPHVLIATSSGGLAGAATVESVLAVALTLRGARVHVLLCDAALPACLLTHMGKYDGSEQFVAEGPLDSLCSSCQAAGHTLFGPLGLPVHRYSDLITPEEAATARRTSQRVPLDALPDYRRDGLNVGEHAYAGALRFVLRSDFKGEDQAPGIAQRYLEAGLRSADALERLFRTVPFEHAVFHHGIYVPQGIIGEVARQEGVHVVNWFVGYRTRCFNFSHHESYHLTLLDAPAAAWENLPWTSSMETELMEYLDSRARGTNDWVQFHDRPNEEAAEIERELGLDFSKPTVALLTNIMWDAQLHFDHNAFSGVREWVLETIRYFGDRPDLQLVVRAHPGEVRGTHPSRQPIIPEILEALGDVPSNVYLIPPDSRISTYTLADHCDAAVIYGTKMGVELSARGIPVIVAGEAWVRNKGVTLDASTQEEYFSLLDRLPIGRRMDEETVTRARKYAYHFFFRSMIPWGFMEPTDSYPPFRLDIEDLEELMPGRDRGLDLVCEGILDGSEFVYPAEERHQSAAAADVA